MIKQVNVITNNVVRELQRVAQENSISASKLYVKVKSVTTFVKGANSDFLEIPFEDLKKYKSETSLRDATLEFDQEYEIDINTKTETYPFKEMISEIELTENDTSAYLVIKKGSKLNYYEDLYSDFLSYITEQKLRSNLMLYLFDVDYQTSVKEFVNVIKQIKKITFKEDKKILISKGYDEIESIRAEVCMTIEDSNDINAEDSEGRVDYANRGFLLSCTEGEELFEFSKPQQGKYGRTCRGEIIEVEVVNLEARPTFTVEDSIEVQDSFENIKYLSKRSGYLIKKGNQYEVSNTIDVNEISFKTTGTIDSDLDSEISINVIKNDPLEDAIEEGMRVKVQTLCITGSIGRNTQIEAREISISGQSHNESTIKCVNATIGVHKGSVVGRRVEVNRLEGGEIVADTVIVTNAISGKIRAKRVEIEILGSYVTIEASEYIKVQKVKGEENKFIIDTMFKGGFDKSREDDEVYLNKLEEEFNSLVKTFKNSTLKVKNNLEPCKKIKATIIRSKKEGVKISSRLIQQFKLCQVMNVRYKKLKEEVEYKKNQYAKLKKKMSGGGLSALDAKIVFNEPLIGFNKVLYRLSDPPVEIELNTDESMKKTTFKLIKDKEGVLKIVNI